MSDDYSGEFGDYVTETAVKVPIASLAGFATGSHVYGTPRKDSDLDIVLLIDDSLAPLLARMVCEANENSTVRYGNDRGFCITAGSLDLILFTEQYKFRQWKAATDHLKSIGPVTREVAVAYFKEHVDGKVPS